MPRILKEFQLEYSQPFDWLSMLEFLKFRAIPGVETVDQTSYARTISLGGKAGDFRITFSEKESRARLLVNFPDEAQLGHIVERIERLFDLKTDSNEIYTHFKKDKLLGPLVRQFPGLRVPGCWDGVEVAVRAILGQQITVKAASTLAARIVQKYGTPYTLTETASNAVTGLSRIFPSAEVLAEAPLDGLGIVGKRIEAIHALAAQVKDEKLNVYSMADSADFCRDVCKIRGIGEWTAAYIALRALHDPDAFPYSDLILRRAAAHEGVIPTARQLLLLAESWQPWRAYAVMLLWKSYGIKNAPNFRVK